MQQKEWMQAIFYREGRNSAINQAGLSVKYIEYNKKNYMNYYYDNKPCIQFIKEKQIHSL